MCIFVNVCVRACVCVSNDTHYDMRTVLLHSKTLKVVHTIKDLATLVQMTILYWRRQ